MLKPSATKLATSASAADLIAAGLRKTRYVKRIAKIEFEAVA
jgi:hypothetical protein